MFINRCYDNNDMGNKMDGNASAAGIAMGGMAGSAMMGGQCGNMCPPVMECPQERVCHRQIFYDVPHIIPINTKIINHHIYRHTYQPCFTCTMEDEVCNVYDHCGL